MEEEFVFPQTSQNVLKKHGIDLEKIPMIEYNPDACPVLIYQMGKVGSSTIEASLQHANVPNVIHCHHLSNQGLNHLLDVGVKNNWKRIDEQFIDGVRVRKLLTKLNQINHEIKVISLVRETISLEVSAVFQNIRRLYPHLTYSKNRLKVPELYEILVKRFNNYSRSFSYFTSWFDDELNRFFNVDVFSSPFNHEKHYQILKFDNVSILLMKMEDINSHFPAAAKEFLGLPDIEIIRTNSGSEKNYKEDYDLILRHLKYPKEVCEDVYSTKVFNHFYTQKEKEGFIKKWVNEVKAD